MVFTKSLEELALLIDGAKVIGNDKIIISDIQHDSRKISQGCLFVCFEGAHFDAHQFIGQAVEAGAVAILTTRSQIEVPDGISVIIVKDILKALSVIVPYFYDYPSRSMRVIGVTGTNGKTTTIYLIRTILKEAGYKIGLIGTIETLVGDSVYPSHNTTPNVIDLQHLLVEMKNQNVDYVVMEVSSHALAENRVAGMEFDVAVFTNLTQDHLDFHGSMENYLATKCKLFDEVSRTGTKSNKTAVVNVDDPSSNTILDHIHCNHLTYGIDSSADLRAADIEVKSTGTKFKIRSEAGVMQLNLHITGLFNIYNAMAAVGAAIAENIRADIICKALESFKAVPGRFERVYVEKDLPFSVIVDYAHTPDGVENVIQTARRITKNRVITVFGCGGDRDRKKRPIMGSLAAELSDIVIATSDNPRTEEPLEILKEIEVGIKEKIANKVYKCIPDRHDAIKEAVETAQSGDIVLVLGKGHENYQILKDKTIHFDDREVVAECLHSKK